MHIMLVNDDGINAKGIRALCLAAVARGHRVSICAPKTQQSAASQRISLTDPIYVLPCPTGRGDVKAYAISGSPTDCVRIGLFELVGEPVDVLLSGVNDGYNAGIAVHYSGTVGAATEGMLLGVRSIAVSVHHKATQTMLDHVAKLAVETAERYATADVPPDCILNINAPLCEPEKLLPTVYAPLSTAGFQDTYVCTSTPRMGDCYWLASGCQTAAPAPGSDLYMLAEGHVTYTLFSHPADRGAQRAELMQSLIQTCE